ncbi:MAG: hypothetical protein ACK4UJ_02810 [Leptonema sp. (in: bacteria)]
MDSTFIYIILIFSILVLTIILNFLFFSKKKSKVILAEIEKIEPIFLKENKVVESFLLVYYKFTVKKKDYRNFCKISFSEFLEIPNSNNFEIFYNKDLELPILKINNEYFVGTEAIEHRILQILSNVPIRYLISDPKRNFVLPLNKKYFLSKK